MVQHEPLEPDNPEAGGGEPAPLSDDEQMRKDVSYSPASETETSRKQDGGLPDTLDDDIDVGEVSVLPGTGGPDDAGDIEVDPDDLNMPN